MLLQISQSIFMCTYMLPYIFKGSMSNSFTATLNFITSKSIFVSRLLYQAHTISGVAKFGYIHDTLERYSTCQPDQSICPRYDKIHSTSVFSNFSFKG